MANMHTRIDRSADRLVAKGLRLKEMLADGRLDDKELEELPALAEALLMEAVEVEDVAVDIAHAKQTLTLGRKATPNRVLRERDVRLALLKTLHATAKRKAQERLELIEGQVIR